MLDLLEKDQHATLETSKESTVPPSPDFTPISWVRWKLLLVNYLTSLIGMIGISLLYVNSEDRTSDEIEVLDDEESLIYQVTLHGNAFCADNIRVYLILK